MTRTIRDDRQTELPLPPPVPRSLTLLLETARRCLILAVVQAAALHH